MYKKTGRLALAAAILFSACLPLFSQALSASLEKSSLWLGESVRMYVVLEGSESEFTPKLAIDGMQITPLGGSRQDSQSITTVNGRTSRQVFYKYVFGFELSPQKAGAYTIPPISEVIDGKTLSTRPLSLTVRVPEKNDSYHLLLSLDNGTAYPGQQRNLTVSLLFGGSIRNLDFRIPGLERIEYYPVDIPDKNQGYQLEINGRNIPFKRIDRTWKGTAYAGVEANLRISSLNTGTVDFGGSTASFEAVVGTKQVRDFFGRLQDQDVYDRLVIPSDDIRLKVLGYPSTGRPEGFFGLAGDIDMTVNAVPLEARIGDPVTLEIRLDNVDNPNVSFPPLKTLLGPGFKIPETRSPDSISGKTKTVTQTIRFVSTDTKKIPSFSIPFFNTADGRYEELKSPEFPVTVLDTDVKGLEDLESANGDTKISTEKRKGGIYYNYAGKDLLERKRPLAAGLLKSPWVWTGFLLPPLGYAGLFLFFSLFPNIRKRQEERRSRREHFRLLSKEIDRGDPRELIGGFLERHYGIRHYSEMDKAFALSEEERAGLEKLLAGDYAGEDGGKPETFDPSVILSIIQERL